MRDGILNNLDMHYPNEPARHKLLDVIGDLALVGMPIKAHIIATRPGPLLERSVCKTHQATDQKGAKKRSSAHLRPEQNPSLQHQPDPEDAATQAAVPDDRQDP